MFLGAETPFAWHREVVLVIGHTLRTLFEKFHYGNHSAGETLSTALTLECAHAQCRTVVHVHVHAAMYTAALVTARIRTVYTGWCTGHGY